MRVLFYLPVVTPWWFERIILPLIEKLVTDHEVHILAPILWQGTGFGEDQYDLCEHLPHIKWHIVTDNDHRSMRTDAVQKTQIIEFVRALNPDFVLCRSADLEISKAFPGIVRHITEGGADPLLLPVGAVHLNEAPFDHGILPPLTDEQRATLSALIEPYWDALAATPLDHVSTQTALRNWSDLPTDRPTLFLPLEYEHKENFFIQHRVGTAPNAKLVEELINEIDGRAFLALTNHPLNELYVDNSALEKVVEAHPHAVRLLPGEAPDGSRTTPHIMRACDGVILGNSKCYSLAGLCGTPILRRSHFRTGEWLNASSDLDTFVTAICEDRAAPPDTETARIWFAFHVANNLVWPVAPALTGNGILERMVKPFDPDRWERNFAVFADDWLPAEGIAA
jgi:hypothetical protein